MEVTVAVSATTQAAQMQPIQTRASFLQSPLGVVIPFHAHNSYSYGVL
jgi:hypothetical protein